jgi:transcriptional regulator with XRE-family HTH domain
MNLVLNIMNTEETLGQRLKRLRKARGLRQEDVADLIGVTPQSIGAIERRSSTSVKMPEIAEALGVSLSYLRTGEEDKPFELHAVENETISNYGIDDISSAIPGAYDKTVNTVRNILFQQGKLENGDIPLIANKDIFLSVLTKAILMEVSGDLFINGLTANDLNSSQKG